jgi:hypothetical protein
MFGFVEILLPLLVGQSVVEIHQCQSRAVLKTGISDVYIQNQIRPVILALTHSPFMGDRRSTAPNVRVKRGAALFPNPPSHSWTSIYSSP